MKKILLTLIILVFGAHFCLAAEDEQPEDLDNIFTNDPQTNVELHGYLEYDEMPEDTVYLEENAYKTGLNLKAPKKIGSKSLLTKSAKLPKIPESLMLENASKFSSQEYSIAPVSNSYSAKSGRISVGATYNSGISSAQSSYSTGIFTRYDGKHFALSSAFSKNTQSSYSSYNDKVYFAPELKLTKRLSLLDIIQTDISQVNRTNEVVLRYSPPLKKYADDVQLELGAGQSFYESNFLNSSVRFSTRFKL